MDTASSGNNDAAVVHILVAIVENWLGFMTKKRMPCPGLILQAGS